MTILRTIYPVIISLTSIPDRFERTFKFINKLLQNVSGDYKLVLNIPHAYKRFTNWNGDVSIFVAIGDPKFQLNRCDDYGPITKLVPTLELYGSTKEGTLLILDDEDYRLDHIKKIVERQESDHSHSFTYYTYHYKNISVGQGVDMLSFWLPNLNGFLEYYHDNVEKSPYCFYVDDLVISNFLNAKGVTITTLPRMSKWVWHPVNSSAPEERISLFAIKGQFSRDNAMRKCYDYISNAM